MDFYYIVSQWADLTGGTFNDGVLFLGFLIFCVFALLGGAIGFACDLGRSLYGIIKRFCHYKKKP